MGAVVLDAWALFAYLRDEPAADAVDSCLREAASGSNVLAISAVNWGEVVYAVTRSAAQPIDAIVQRLDELPVALVPAGRGLALRAASLKAAHRLGYADAYAAALALAMRAPLMTGDPHLRDLPGLELVWLGG